MVKIPGFHWRQARHHSPIRHADQLSQQVDSAWTQSLAFWRMISSENRCPLFRIMREPRRKRRASLFISSSIFGMSGA